MQHSKPLYCLSISTVTGVRLDQTLQYEVEETGFRFRVPFTKINYVRTTELVQPINLPRATYFFGFDPSKLLQIAQVAYDDVLEGIKEEIRLHEMQRRKLNSGWEETCQSVQAEMDKLMASGGVPQVGTEQSEPPQSPAPAAGQTPQQAFGQKLSENAPQEPSAPEPPRASKPPQNPNTGPESVPDEQPADGGKPKVVQRHFEIYYAACMANAKRTEACAYYARIKDMESGRVREVKGDGKSKDKYRLQAVAIKETLARSGIPASTATEQCIVTLYVPDEHFNKTINRFLPIWAKNGWKKKDGNEVSNRDMFEEIFKQMQNMTLTAKQCEASDSGYTFCVDEARHLADAKHHQIYGNQGNFIPPGTYTGS